MARDKPQHRNSLLLPVVLSEQFVPDSFAFALDYLVNDELDLSAPVSLLPARTAAPGGNSQGLQDLTGTGGAKRDHAAITVELGRPP